MLLTPPHPTYILYPSCWRSNSPLSAQRSSSTPAGGQIHPSPPGSHPQPLIVVKLTRVTPLRPAVILNPAGGQTHPSPTSGHPPPLLMVKLTPLCPAVILNPCWSWHSLLFAQRSSSTPCWRSTAPLPRLLVFQGETHQLIKVGNSHHILVASPDNE